LNIIAELGHVRQFSIDIDFVDLLCTKLHKTCALLTIMQNGFTNNALGL